VNKNFEILKENYSFAGGILLDTDYRVTIEEYVPYSNYDSVWFHKNDTEFSYVKVEKN